MKKFNIALLHYSCPPVVGGVEEVVRQQANLFHRYYHNVKIFAGAGKQFTQDYSIEINPLLGSRNRQVLFAHEQIQQGNQDPLQNLANQIFDYLSENLKGFDILIAHNVLTMPYNLPLVFALFRLAQEEQIRLISWNHDSPYFYPDYPDYLNRAPWTALRKFHAKISYVVISESRKKEFAKLYGTEEHLYVIPNGIDPIAFFQLDHTTVRLIQEEQLFLADFLMVQPSRLHPRKNVELSIQVVRALHDLGVNARLLVTGAYDPHEPKTVEYYRKLKSLAKELRVQNDVLIMAEYRFKSGEPLTPDRIMMRDLYLISDIVFLPSLQEGFGIPVLESGMIKLPVVCSNIPPFQEIGNTDVCIFELTSPPEAIAQQIIDFLGKLPTQRLFRRVIKEYVWDNIYMKRLLPFFCDLLGIPHDEITEN